MPALRPARWPDLEEAIRLRETRVVLAAAHLDHDPRHNRLRNLKRALVQTGSAGIVRASWWLLGVARWPGS